MAIRSWPVEDTTDNQTYNVKSFLNRLWKTGAKIASHLVKYNEMAGDFLCPFSAFKYLKTL